MVKEVHITKNLVDLIYPNKDVRAFGLPDSDTKSRISREELTKIQGYFDVNLV